MAHGTQRPDQGLNRGSQRWEGTVIASGPPAKSRLQAFKCGWPEPNPGRASEDSPSTGSGTQKILNKRQLPVWPGCYHQMHYWASVAAALRTETEILWAGAIGAGSTEESPAKSVGTDAVQTRGGEGNMERQEEERREQRARWAWAGAPSEPRDGASDLVTPGLGAGGPACQAEGSGVTWQVWEWEGDPHVRLRGRGSPGRG